MECGGCTQRRAAIKRWWQGLFAKPKDDWMPEGVQVALELADALKQHCWNHSMSGTFAGVIVPPQEECHEPTALE